MTENRGFQIVAIIGLIVVCLLLERLAELQPRYGLQVSPNGIYRIDLQNGDVRECRHIEGPVYNC